MKINNSSEIHQRIEIMGQATAPRIGETDSRYRESQLPRAIAPAAAETALEPALVQQDLNCNRQTVRASVR